MSRDEAKFAFQNPFTLITRCNLYADAGSCWCRPASQFPKFWGATDKTIPQEYSLWHFQMNNKAAWWTRCDIQRQTPRDKQALFCRWELLTSYSPDTLPRKKNLWTGFSSNNAAADPTRQNPSPFEFLAHAHYSYWSDCNILAVKVSTRQPLLSLTSKQ